MKRVILVIEDNEQNLYLAGFLLKKAGYEVIAVRDGRSGIETAAAVKPDLILLDIQLPVMDGYDVAREIRRNPDLAATPLVAVTSYAMPGDREKSMAAGCDGYMEKPIDPDSFINDIRRFLNDEHSREKKP